jgi:hypothetical protein
MEKLVQKLKEVTGVTDVTSLSNTNPAVRVIARELGVCIPTIQRWAMGIAEPHRAMLPAVFAVLDNISELQAILRTAPWNEPSILRKIFVIKELN